MRFIGTVLAVLLLLVSVAAPETTSAQTPDSDEDTDEARTPDSDKDTDLPRTGDLFYVVKGDPPPSPGVDAFASRLVGIDFGQLNRITESPADPKGAPTGEPPTLQTLALNLFDGVVFTGIVEHVEPTASGHALWGRLDGVELGTMTLVVNGDVVVGTVRTPGAVYTIRTAGDGTYVIRQIDESSLPPLGEPLEASPSGPSPESQAASGPPDDGSEIDVMVVYTPAARHREGGRAAIEAFIDLSVAETNHAYANSGVIHRIRLALREEVEYEEYRGPGQSFVDLDRLTRDSDGYMDYVHVLRDLYAVDLVHLVTGYGNVCGLAFISIDEEGWAAESGFGLTLSGCGGLVVAHELGHNMGLSHDRYSILKSLGTVSIAGSNFGYVNQRMFEPAAPESSYWITIMAYGTQCYDAGLWCNELPYFSNPELTYNGDPMGVPVNHPSTGVDGPADAVRTLNATREIIANYRQRSTAPPPRVSLTLSPYWLHENGGTSTVTATLSRPSSADTAVTVSASPDGAVSLSANRTLIIPAGGTTSSGEVTITGVDNGDRTGDVSVTVSATAENTSSQGVTPPDPVELAIADNETTPVVTLSLSPAEIIEGEGRTFLTATLDNRSQTETTLTLSASPAEIVQEIEGITLTIPAGQTTTSGWPVEIGSTDDSVFTEARKRVTISAAATSTQGVTGPESVTLTVIDDEAPIFANDSVAYTFTVGVAGSRLLPEATHGDGPLTYSIYPSPGDGVTFTPGPPARIGVSEKSVAGQTSYALIATDTDGDAATMTVGITARAPVCPGSAAVSGYADPGIVADCEALLAARDLLAGSATLNWSEDTPITEWDGVWVEGTPQRVTRLHLRDRHLTGQIPSELGSLSNLTELSLSNNQLDGPIPPELGNLSNLRILSLGSNQLSGTIPSDLGNLPNLEWLSPDRNHLSGPIPPELGRLTNLRGLELSFNQLSGTIPAELGSLSDLEFLGLSGNRLTGAIPPEFGSLANLTGMHLWGNRLDGTIPAGLGSLTNLVALDLNSNQLTGPIPPELGSLADLQVLLLSRNQLTGPIPSELGNLPNLRYLSLRYNRLTGCISEGLRDLEVEDHDLDELGLPFCEDHVCVADGAVTDVNNTGLVSDCETLLAARDTLAGSATLNWSSDIPIARWDGVSVGETSARVTALSLRSAGLSGTIPKELAALSELASLDLRGNRLSGKIPAGLGDLPNLESLYLSGNLLTGCISEGLRDVPNNDFAKLGLPFCGDFICIAGGAVTDETNTELASDCETLLAARDTLAGASSLNWSADTPITDWEGVRVGGTPQLVTRLRLWDRHLTGEIPPELGSLSNLTELSLSDNQLDGPIPPELGDLSNLRWLRLNNNQLTGSIPPELGNLSNLTRMWLSENQLTGSIPPELDNLSNLTSLSLSGNLLTGCIPASLQSVANNDLDELGLPTCGIPTVYMIATTITPMVRINSPILVSAAFSEAVNGFTADDVTVANGDIGNFSGSDGDSVFTFEVAPNAIGVVTVDIPAGVATDSDGEANTAAAQLILGLPYDDDRNGIITRDEVLNAIEDYLSGDSATTRDHVLDLIELYLSG